MKSWGRLWAYIVAAFAVTLLVAIFKRPVFETSLERLVGGSDFSLPIVVKNAVSSRVQVVSSSKTFEDAFCLAKSFVSRLDTNKLENLTFSLSDGQFHEIIDFYSQAGGGFLSKEDVSLYETTNLQNRVWSDVFCSFKLLPVQVDPLGFLDRFVKSLPRGWGRWSIKDGVLFSEANGFSHILISFSLPKEVALDIKALPVVLGPVTDLCNSLNKTKKNAKLSISGVSLHTLETSSRCEREIAILSIFSFLFILCLALKVTTSVKSLCLIATNLVVSMSLGFAVLSLAFDSIHLLSLVFGTTLMGLAVDYSFHSLLAAKGKEEQVGKNLTKSFITTVVSFLPLAFSALPALVQTAVFLTAGLLSSLLFSKLLLSCDSLRCFLYDSSCVPVWILKLESSLVSIFVIPVVVLFAIYGLIFSNFHTGASDLHSPSRQLNEAEKLIGQLSSMDESAGMAVVQGKTLEEVLQKEERFFENSISLSKFVPSLATREANYRRIKFFLANSGATILKEMGLDGALAMVLPKKLGLSDIPLQIIERFVFVDGNGDIISIVPKVSPLDAKNISSTADGVMLYAPREMIARLINTHEKRAVILLVFSFVLLALVLGISYKLRALIVLMPSFLAVCSVFAFEQLVFGNVNFFHLLASFMIVGMALDYTIFLAEDFRGALRSVSCSFLTSLAGFGALSFVSFPIMRSFGSAFAVGLPVSFVVAWAIFKPRIDKNERASTPFGMELAWVLYRVFGKGFFDFIAWAVANIVWIFDPVARKAASSRKKMINFAQSLADKVAVLSMGKGQPKVVFEETEDARWFLDDVAQKKGAIVVSSHLGNIETLAAYGESAVKFHVFMSLSKTATFRSFKDRHSRRTMIDVHPTEGFGIAELFLASSIVEEGGVVLIAGDRGSGRVKEYDFLGSKRNFPEGAFRFAGHLQRNAYFIASIREKSVYRVFVKQLPPDDMPGVYVRELERLVKKYPDQWYQWETKGGGNG